MKYDPTPRRVCLERDGIYVCTLTVRHPGPHQAWAGDQTMRHEWPSETPHLTVVQP